MGLILTQKRFSYIQHFFSEFYGRSAIQSVIQKIFSDYSQKFLYLRKNFLSDRESGNLAHYLSQKLQNFSQNFLNWCQARQACEQACACSASL